MKTRHLLLAALPLFVTPAYAADEEGAPLAPRQNTTTTQPAGNIARWADRCTNFTTNGWAFKAPRNFLQWLDVFSDPGIYLEFGRRGLDPKYLVASLDSLLDPATARNYLEWSNPDIYNQWARAAAEPEFYTAVNSILFDPGRMMRWVMLPLDGKTWELAGTAVNPATWLKWLNAPLDPNTQELFAKAANPETVQRWLDALGDPVNTPWFNTPSVADDAQPAAQPSDPYALPAAARVAL